MPQATEESIKKSNFTQRRIWGKWLRWILWPQSHLGNWNLVRQTQKWTNLSNLVVHIFALSNTLSQKASVPNVSVASWIRKVNWSIKLLFYFESFWYSDYTRTFYSARLYSAMLSKVGQSCHVLSGTDKPTWASLAFLSHNFFYYQEHIECCVLPDFFVCIFSLEIKYKIAQYHLHWVHCMC